MTIHEQDKPKGEAHELFHSISHPGEEILPDLVDDEPTDDELFEVQEEAEKIEEETLYTDDIDSTDITGVYFKSLPPFRKLSIDEEAELGKRIEKGKNFFNIPFEQLSETEQATVQDAQLARQELTEANLRLVIRLAKRYSGDHLTFDDFIQEGNIGLIVAVDKYDYTRGFKFCTIATWWILQRIRNGLHSSDRTIRIPVETSVLYFKIRKFEEQLLKELARQPTTQELAENLDNISEDKLEKILRLIQKPQSLEQSIVTGDEYETSLEEITSDREASVFTLVAHMQLRSTIQHIFDTYLTEREAKILSYRLSLFDGDEYTLEATGNILGLTRERIRQIQESALNKLKKPEVAKFLKDFLHQDSDED